MGYFVGAYATSPSSMGWNAEVESDYYRQLKACANIVGLEHPFTGRLHGHDDDWFLANVDPNWDYVFTTVPGVMGSLKTDPNFGIASTDEAGRQSALSFMQGARDAIAKLNQHLGRQAVKAIQVQTAPNQSKACSSTSALQASLETMLEWDWQGAQLLIEHCDTFVEGQTPSKGFLSIEQEIAVLKEVNANTATPLAMVINWGRSVIETRNLEGANQHIKLAKEAGLLAGLMFSGVSDADTEYGAWKDTHMPPTPLDESCYGAPDSWLTPAQIQASIEACGELPEIVGIKLGIRPRDSSLADRVACNKDALAILDKFIV